MEADATRLSGLRDKLEKELMEVEEVVFQWSQRIQNATHDKLVVQAC